MTWKQLCKLEEVEQCSMNIVNSDDTEFLVLRGEEGEILVVPPSCPHMSASLCEGFFDGSLLTCSKHLWQWSVKDGTARGVAEVPLAVYPSKEVDGAICVDFEEELRYAYQTKS
jgi:toluene monooxygenase system ferredoxin subunit